MTDLMLSAPDHRLVLAHYEKVAPVLAGRFGAIPVAWVNYPRGFGDRGIFHKEAHDVPESVATVPVETSSGTHPYVALATNALLWLIHAKYAVEFISWTPHAEALDRPAFGHVTLVPCGRTSEDQLFSAATALRARFEKRSVTPVCLLDGFRGITLWFPAPRGSTYDDVARFAGAIVAEAVAAEPTLFTHAPLKADRGDRISLGIKSNHPGMGVLLPYAVRGTPGLEIAWPVAWDGLGSVRNGDVRAENFAATFARTGDVFGELVAAYGSPAPAPFARPAAQLAVRRREVPSDPATDAPPGPSAHDFILQAALVVLADGAAHSADQIRDSAVAKGLLPASTTAKYVYTALHEYVMRTIGAGRKPPFVQTEHAATFRLNRPVDAWPEVPLPALPRWLDDASIERLIRALDATATGGDPAAFEVAVCDAFAALGFATRHVGGEGMPDGLIDAPLGELGWRGVLECKTASPGGIVANPRPEEPAKFCQAYGAARSALVGPAFSNDASFLGELRVHDVSLWTTADLGTALREQIGPDELTPAFAAGIAAEAIASLLWERAHGERKRVAVTARTIVDRGWTAQQRLARANAPAASPRLTEDALLVLVDEALGAIDPTIVVRRETVDAATLRLAADGAIRTIGDGADRHVVVRAPLHADGTAAAFCAIVPPYVLEAMREHDDAEVREAARSSLLLSERMRGRRPLEAMLARISPLVRSADESEQRRVFTSNHTTKVPGMIVRSEGSAPSGDASVDEAYDAAGIIFDFYREAFGRNSVDDRGMHLLSSVHYAHRFDNAFWNGLQMVYGDGDGKVFGAFTACVDVIGHEMTHGVVQTEAGLAYEDQPGALNESLADVFGSLAKQWHRKQTALEADWLIGAGLLKHPGARALRSMKAPGTAYDDPALGGKDPQPAHMRDFVHTRADDGGVHVNSGIPNHAFFLLATALGGHAWETAGKIWYEALCSGLRETTDFHAFAHATSRAAERHGAAVEQALRAAWADVGIVVAR